MSIFIVLALILISFVVFTLVIFNMITRYRRIMLWVCFVFVALGFSLYTASYLSSGEGFAYTLHATLRGIYSVARMFSIEDDLSALVSSQETEWLAENILVQCLFWFCHIAVLIILQIALVTLFGRKLIDSFRLRFGLHREVYIIKGADKNALLLGENIVAHDGKRKRPDKKRIIVFLLEEDDDEKSIYEKAARFGGIVQVLNREDDFLSSVKKAGLTKNSKKIFNIIMMRNDASISNDTRKIAEYAQKNSKDPDKLDIFVITSSQWDREEIEAITQEKEDHKRKYPYTFHITDEADIITRQMVLEHPPYKCLKFNEGKADRDFTVMILGFGTVGQRALLRLVMNGQFVGSRMRVKVIDKDNTCDYFLHRYPGLELCCDMDFINLNIQSKEFFNLLDEVRNIDYIVITLCGDEINKQTALDIRLHYERKNDNTLPSIAVLERKGLLRRNKQDKKIFTFGCCEDVYKESVIIRAEVDRMAKTVNDTYKEMYGGQSWHELDWFLQESNRASADFIPAMLELAKCEKEDAMKMTTLTEDSSLEETLSRTEHLRWNAFHAAMGYRHIDPEEMRRRFEEYKEEEKNTREHLDYSRRDSKAWLHACLVSWEELDTISRIYQELARRATDEKEQERNVKENDLRKIAKEQTRDFKDNDRDIIKNIPLFLRKEAAQNN